MGYKQRQGPRDLKEIKRELGYARNEAEILNLDAVVIHINKAENIVDASLRRNEEYQKRRGEC